MLNQKTVIGLMKLAIGGGGLSLLLTACGGEKPVLSPQSVLPPPKMAASPIIEVASEPIIDPYAYSNPDSQAKAAPDPMMESTAVQPLKPRYMEPKQSKPVMTLGAMKLWTPSEPGRLLRVRLPAGSRLWERQREIKVAPNGTAVFALHRDSSGSIELEIHYPKGGVEVVSLPIQPRSYDIQHINNFADPSGYARPDRSCKNF